MSSIWRVWGRREGVCALTEPSRPTMSASSSSWMSAETLLPGGWPEAVYFSMNRCSFHTCSPWHNPTIEWSFTNMEVILQWGYICYHSLTAGVVVTSVFPYDHTVWTEASQCSCLHYSIHFWGVSTQKTVSELKRSTCKRSLYVSQTHPPQIYKCICLVRGIDYPEW